MSLKEISKEGKTDLFKIKHVDLLAAQGLRIHLPGQGTWVHPGPGGLRKPRDAKPECHSQ